MAGFHRGVVAALLISVACFSAPARAADSHAHDGAANGHGARLTLDHGRKWATDAPLRQGMAGIAGELSGVLDAIHAKRFSSEDYDRLADGISRRIDAIAKDCRLPEAADAQLHLVLADIIGGVDMMKAKTPDRSRGAETIVKALDGYQTYFDHPGWRPIAH